MIKNRKSTTIALHLVGFWLILLTFFVQVSVSYAEPSYPVPPLVLAYSPDGSKIAGCGDQLLRIWDALTGEMLLDFPTMNDTYIESIAWSPNSDRLATVSDDQFLRVWNISDSNYNAGQLLMESQPFWEAMSLITSVDWSSDGQFIATGGVSDDYSLKIWDGTTYALVKQLAIGWIEKLAWNPDSSRNQFVIAGDLGGPVFVSSVTPLSGAISAVGGRNIPSGAMAWNSDGSQIAIGYEDGGVYVWDSSTNEQLAVMSGTDENRITQVAWSPDNTRIAAANGTVRVWESSNGQLLQTLSGTSLSVDFSPDGTHLVYANGGGAIQIVSAPLLPEMTLNAPTATETATPTG